MKTAAFALFGLSLITALCVFSSNKINAVCKETKAYVALLPESTDGVDLALCEEAVDKWEKDSAFLSFFISSYDIASVKESLITVRNAVATASDDEFAAAKAALMADLSLMADAESVRLDNIF